MSRTSHQRDRKQRSLRQPFVEGVLFLVVMCVLVTVGAGSVRANQKEELIPILGTTMGVSPVGEVVYLSVTFEERTDHAGLAVQFKQGPGGFSPMVQTTDQQGIDPATPTARLSTAP